MPSPRRDRRPSPRASSPPRPKLVTVTVRIDRLAAGGDGIARLGDGLVVFVAGAAPGEEVEIALDRSRKPAEGRVLRVLTASADRVTPPCPVVAVCGGCDWMHLAASAQQREHATLVEGALARTFPGVALPAITAHPSTQPLAYRTRARLFVKAEKGRIEVGYRGKGSHDLVVAPACAVLDSRLTPLLSTLPVVLRGAKGTGDVQIALGEGGKPTVDLTWRGTLDQATWAALDARVNEGAWAGARVALEGVSAPASFGDPRPRLLGADGAPLAISAGGFAQPSDAGGAHLARRVDALARLTTSAEGLVPLWKEPGPRHIVELFAGSGTLSVLLAKDAASFTAVELDADAAACARQNLGDRSLAAKVVTAGAEAFVLPPRTEIVVLDPPRTGAADAMPAIAASAARAVIYVACDPPTMARDLAILAQKGFILTHLETFELFPQTSHVETVARLIRGRPLRPGASRALA